MINLIYTSRPHDGLFYYSYEYGVYLSQLGYDVRLVIYPNFGHSRSEYLDAIQYKYKIIKAPVFGDRITDDFIKDTRVNILMGRSLLLFAKNVEQQYPNIKKLLSNNMILVYNNNHDTNTQQKMVEHFSPKTLINLCDHDVYIEKIGKHFQKSIYPDIYSEHYDHPQFEYIMNGSNERYYKKARNVLHKYPDARILTYKKHFDNDLQMPVKNLFGLFCTYVYTKDYFDPAPRMLQESSYFKKNIIFDRNSSIRDGGYVYYNRHLRGVDFNLRTNKTAKPLVDSIEELI